MRKRNEAGPSVCRGTGSTSPVRGKFALPVWVTRGRQRSEVTATAPRRESAEFPRRMELLVDEITSNYAVMASTVSLLRARARDIAHRRNQLLRISHNERVRPFTWITPEGSGSSLERTCVQRRYIDRIVVDVKEIEPGIHRNPDAIRRLRLANRGSGRFLRELRERRESIVNELASRVGEYRAVPSAQSTCRLVDREGGPVEVQGCRSVLALADPVGNSRHIPYVVPRDRVRSNSCPGTGVSGEKRRLYSSTL